nr:hypothetical protein [Tanacetum cinerariifolium]
MTSLANKAILSGANNHPPMLEKDMYGSWKSQMELYMLNRQHERMILEYVKSGPLLWPTIEENGVTRLKKYSELSTTEAIQADCDIKATNIIQKGLPPEVYALVNTKFLNTLPPEWSKFVTDVKLVRDLHTTNVDQLHAYLGQHEYHANEFQVNTKFLNTLPPKWSKFVTDVKLVRDLHMTNVDQLHDYVGQHEFHAIKVRLMHEPIHQMIFNHHNVYNPSSSIPQVKYAPSVHQQSNFSQPDSGLIVLVF